jgi:glycosyltransferase involved in cell wall biosynthesis
MNILQVDDELCEGLAGGDHKSDVSATTGEPQTTNHERGIPPSRLAITVLCGQPNANPTGAAYRRWGREVRHGVTIHRVWHTQFAKGFLPGRAVNYISFLLTSLWAACWTQRPDVVVVETDPPLLSLIGGLLQRWRGAQLIVYLQDIHPDIAVALGKLRANWLTRLLRRRLFAVYCRADRVVVLSRDMRQHVIAGGVSAERVVIVPNWIDVSVVYPIKQANVFRQRHGIEGRFLVMYSGNLGLCQRLEDVIAAAEVLRARTDILFLLVGAGVLQRQLEAQVARLSLANVRFLPYEPKSRLAESLSAADVHLVPLDARVAACLMPSKFYGVLASGSPLIAVAPEACELAQLAREHGLGLVVPPGDPAALAAAIERLASQPAELFEMGRRARRLAERQFDRRTVTARFADVLNSVLPS